jgi:uncharacterized protein (DUF58 family)
VRKRPTKRALIFVAAGGLLVLVGSTALAGWLFVLAATVFGVVAYSLVALPKLDRYEVDRSVAGRAAVGDRVEVRLTLRNKSSKGFLPGARAVDTFEAFDAFAVACDGLGPRAAAGGTASRRAIRRGVYSGGDVVLATGWPFGLMRSTRSILVRSPLTVVPHAVELDMFPITEASTAQIASDRVAAHTGAGEQFLGVREYRAGDDARHIHWRSSARRSHLVVREYEDEAAERVALLISGADDGAGPGSSFETLVSAAASVAVYAQRQNLTVELARPAGDGGVDRFASSRAGETLDWLASAKAVDGSLLALVASVLGSGYPPGAVVLLAPTGGRAGAEIVDAVAAVRTRGVRAVAVIADSATWSHERPGSVPALPVPSRVLTKGRELAQCLRG